MSFPCTSAVDSWGKHTSLFTISTLQRKGEKKKKIQGIRAVALTTPSTNEQPLGSVPFKPTTKHQPGSHASSELAQL